MFVYILAYVKIYVKYVLPYILTYIHQYVCVYVDKYICIHNQRKRSKLHRNIKLKTASILVNINCHVQVKNV